MKGQRTRKTRSKTGCTQEFIKRAPKRNSDRAWNNIKKSTTKMELINKVLDLRRQLQQLANVTTEVDRDSCETISEIQVTHRDEPIIGNFAFTPTFNQLLH